MSLFRRPKKANIQRRVFSALDEDDDEENTRKSENEASTSNKSSKNGDSSGKMDVDERCKTPPPPSISHKHDKKIKDPSIDKKSSKKTSLLSFGDDEDEGEVFQVKKTSHSKKVMKMLDKERRRKKLREKDGQGSNESTGNDRHSKTDNRVNSKTNACDVVQATSYETVSNKGIDHDDINLANKKRQKSSQISNSSIHTEIRTDDFVLVVKKTEPEPKVILNGRAALCAGRDDMSDDESESIAEGPHRFKKPAATDSFKSLLESGAIPNAAMIHEARKKRQKARELGDYVALEEKPVDNRKGRLIREEAEDDVSDDERVDMSAITGSKEREERREKFYSVQHGSDEDSDQDLNEWESQQIRKAISGSQLMNAQQEAYSHFLIKDGTNVSPTHISTGNLLEQAYASTRLETTRPIKLNKKLEKKTGPRMPHEIRKSLEERLKQVKELNASHFRQIEEITNDIKVLGLGQIETEQNAPVAAAKYRFYQELKGYVLDLIDCFDEKVPKIVELEKKYYVAMERYWNYCVERRRRDVTEQASEITQAQKQTSAAAPMNAEARRLEERRAQRAAEREGRRTRRRRDRERIDICHTHFDGMSSDDEVPEQEATLYKNQLKQISAEATLIFEDASEEFCELPDILKHFVEWRNRDMTSYKDTYFSLCLPKIVGPIVRLNMITWNLLDENCKDIEKMEWYETLMKYGYKSNETETDLADDPDVRLVPTVVERVILPKITECIQKAWDPCSSTQTLRLVNLLRRLIRDYPSLKPTSKYMKTMFTAIFDKMRLSLESDVFIPFFPNQSKEAKSSFFQRQFSSALKLFRNLLSWEGILSDSALKEIAIASLLNRYLLSAIRLCAPNDAIAKSHIIVNTMPRVWLQQKSIVESMNLFIQFVRSLSNQIDHKSPLNGDAVEKLTQLFGTFHLPLTTD